MYTLKSGIYLTWLDWLSLGIKPFRWERCEMEVLLV